MKYPLVIAEIGANHNGDMALAKKLIKTAQECGADAVKFQLLEPYEINTHDQLVEMDKGVVKLENVPEWKSPELGLNNIFDQLEKFTSQIPQHIQFFDYAREIGIKYCTSVFDKWAVDFCLDQKVLALKIASCDVTNLDLIEYCLSKDYPLMIALGMASLGEIENIVNLIPKSCRKNVTLLHCISIYPPEDNIVNLRFLQTLKDTFGLNIGYSDHTLGFSIPLAAVTMGATVIEKHFTLDHNMPGWDHKVSANPDEMRIICKESKRIIDALGTGMKVVSEAEMQKRKSFRRSMCTKRALKAGQEITYDDICFKRPGIGISSDRYKEVIGRHAAHDIDIDKTLFWEDLVK